jgi:succinoglycan biosynthesis transport protein ExoP
VVIGVVLACGAAYLLEYMDDTLKDPDDVQANLGLTTLGAVPRMSVGGEQLVALADSRSAATEAYRVLRTNLQFAAVGMPLHTLLITSASPSEGKSLTAANLSIALAQAGKRVIAVDADLHRPRLHQYFDLPNGAGVTTALLQEQPSLDGLLQPHFIPNLRVLTSGPLPPNAAELLGSARMRDLMTLLKEEADVVVLDSPPAGSLSDAAVLSAQTDGVLLVVDAGITRRDLALRTVEALRRVNAHVVGVLLNRVRTRGSVSYYYSDHGRKNGNASHAQHSSRWSPATSPVRSSRLANLFVWWSNDGSSEKIGATHGVRLIGAGGNGATTAPVEVEAGMKPTGSA